MYQAPQHQEPGYGTYGYGQQQNLPPPQYPGTGFEEQPYTTKYNEGADERLGFIRKVYGILSAQLVFTLVICLIPFYSNGYANFLKAYWWTMIITLVLAAIIMISLFCCGLSKTVPTNYILTGLFTFFEAYSISVLLAFSDPGIVLMAAIMTTAMVVGLTVYAMTTKTDFTVWMGAIFILSIGLLLFGIFLLFTNNNILHIIYCTLGIIIFGFYLIIDTQLIVGGQSHKIELDDYILGAMMLYMDIIYIFVKMIELLSRLKNN